MATTGNFWNVTNPLKPVGLFDPDGVYDISMHWEDWLAGLGQSYWGHQIICQDGLTCPISAASVETPGVITVRIQKDPMFPLVAGQKYSFTCRITTDVGQVEDQTLFLKVTEK